MSTLVGFANRGVVDYILSIARDHIGQDSHPAEPHFQHRRTKKGDVLFLFTRPELTLL